MVDNPLLQGHCFCVEMLPLNLYMECFNEHQKWKNIVLIYVWVETGVFEVYYILDLENIWIAVGYFFFFNYYYNLSELAVQFCALLIWWRSGYVGVAKFTDEFHQCNLLVKRRDEFPFTSHKIKTDVWEVESYLFIFFNEHWF